MSKSEKIMSDLDWTKKICKDGNNNFGPKTREEIQDLNWTGPNYSAMIFGPCKFKIFFLVQPVPTQ